MEVDLAFDDIILYRSLADALLKGEKKKRDEAAKQQSWWSWATGGGPAIKDEKVADLTQEDWQRLYSAINFEEKPVAVLVEPADVRGRLLCVWCGVCGECAVCGVLRLLPPTFWVVAWSRCGELWAWGFRVGCHEGKRVLTILCPPYPTLPCTTVRRIF